MAEQHRYAMELPDGTTVAAEITPEILAVAARVRRATLAGREPDAWDLARLMAWADTGQDDGES